MISPITTRWARVSLFLCLTISLVLHNSSLFAEEQTAEFSDKRPIRIGASLSLTGIYKEPSNMIKRGYELWVQETNRKGGLLGRPLELQILDDRSSVEEARGIYHDLIEEQQVDLLLAPYGTPITLAVSEITEAAGYVLVSAGAAGTQIWRREFKYIFGVYSTADRLFIGFLDLIARNRIDEISIVHENNPFNIEAAMGAVEWAKKLGIGIKQRIEFSPETYTPEEILRQAGLSDNAALIFCSYPEEGYAFLQALQEHLQQPAAVCMTIAPVHPLFAKRLQGAAEGVFGPSQWEPEERIPYPGTREFISAFRRFAHVPPSYHAGAAFAAGQVLARSIEATASLDNAVLRDAIATMDTVTIIGRFKVDNFGRQIGHNPILIQWQGGKKEIVYPSQLKTAEPQFNNRSR
ncbi:MAG TPA: amino acid ABC transporter substrate-binding protein [Clostridia bacterium]|nr:amino acid ABC transporter substrate-binding protein [Clostridia bacterium]